MPIFLVMWIHMIAVVTWIGGLLFFPLVLRPALHHLPSDSHKAEILRRVGSRFRTVVWVSIITLILTGAFNMLSEGGSARIASMWGAVLILKLFVVAVAVGLTLVHDFILDPYAPRTSGAPPVPTRTASVAWLEHAVLALTLCILLIAAYLARM